MARHALLFTVLGAASLLLVLASITNLVADENKEGETASAASASQAVEREVTQGALRIVQQDGSIVECPLKHTDVQADVSGFIARVNVTQTFQNPTDEKIEAVYVFPLPHKAAVDSMTMIVGQRRIVGLIKRRAEARQIYEQALMQGQTAALLEQERPNIFTQSVGNIEPGQEVRIEISYVDVLKYDVQEYEFYFPMVVGPRFIPGQPSGAVQPTPRELQGKVSPPVGNTTRVPDAERISPPVLRPGYRNGHDISLSLTIDAGVPIDNLKVTNHEADVERRGTSGAVIKLAAEDSVPNKDFVVRYDVVGAEPEMALLTHTGEYSKDAASLGDGYFMLMIQPKEDERLRKSPPREIVFLVDVSGSMRGAKTAKTVETMKQMLGLCREIDTVQVVTFASRAQKLFERPLPVSESSIQRALNFADQIQGSGGTHMLQGVKMAIDEPIDEKRIRIVVMLTDGFIGNEAEIIEHVGKECGDHVRFWAVGIGQSPNMFLVDGVAKQGGGMGKRLGLSDEAEILATEIMTRIQRAQLTDIQIDWGTAQVSETYPVRIPELWAGRPVILYGRFSEPGEHRIVVRGSIEGEPATWPLTIQLPRSEPAHDVLAKVWARQRIEDLMQQAYYGDSPAVEEEVTAIALDYRLMSQYTSFVAVDESRAEAQPAVARPPRRMLVPVPLPEGAEWEGFFGRDLDGSDMYFSNYFSFGLRKQTEDKSSPVRLMRMSSGLSGSPRGALPSPGAGPGAPFGTPALGIMPSSAPSRPAVRRLATADRMVRSPQPSFGYGAGGMGGMGGMGGTSFGHAGRTPTLESRGRAAGYWYAPVDAKNQNVEAAEKLIEQQVEEVKNGDSQARRQALIQAFFRAKAATNMGQPDGGVAATAVQQLTEMHDKQVKQWQAEVPALSRKLDLVLRDQSIQESLDTIARAAAMDIDLVQHSDADVQQLMGIPAHVTWIDLRGASVAQALDWVLQPLRLSWRVEKGTVLAGSARRLPGKSAWVYDVAQIAIPDDKELGESQNAAEIAKVVRESADTFSSVVRSQLAGGDEDSSFWFGPGQLVVFGNPEMHAKIGRLLQNLSSAEGRDLAGEAGQLQRLTRQRAQAARERAGDQTKWQLQSYVAQAHAVYGWQLLAAAAQDRFDDQAATELRIAWQSPATIELLKGDGRSLMLRSLWAVTEASRAMPDEPRLAELAGLAAKLARPHISDAAEVVKKSPADMTNFLGLLYATLALPEGDELRHDCSKLLLRVSRDEKSLQPAVRTVGALLEPAKVLDSAQLEADLTSVKSEDLLVLAAFACRDAGSDTWAEFRRVSRDVLRQMPVAGNVIVLINHLSA